MQRTSCCLCGGAKISMTTSGSTFTEDEYKTRTYEDLSSEFQKLYSQVVRAYQLIPQMYNRLTLVDRLSHIEAMLKMANDHKHLPGFSDRNVRRYLPSHNPNIPRQVRTSRPKNSGTISVDNPKLSMSEHKQNELINASKSTHIEISSCTDMDYDVTKISPLQLDKRGQIVSPPSSSPTTTSKSTIDHPSSRSDNSNQVQNDNHLHFEFGLPVQEVLRHLIPGIPGIITKEDNERQIWFSGILDKSTCQVISATVGRITLS
jgi:hypothetical protein